MSKTRDHVEMEKRRQQAAKLFAKGHAAPEVARRLGVARQVAYRWKNAWEQGGRAALASKGPAGRKSKLTAQQTQQVTQALLAGPAAVGYKTALWTLPRVAGLIENLTGVRYHPGHVWRLLGASGFSCQRPERRAVERDEQAIRRWKRGVWPALKKSPLRAGALRLPSCGEMSEAGARTRFHLPRNSMRLREAAANRRCGAALLISSFVSSAFAQGSFLTFSHAPKTNNATPNSSFASCNSASVVSAHCA